MIVGDAASAAGNEAIADQRNLLFFELLLLQATVIHALHLNADLFGQAVERVVGADAARTMGGMTVLVRVKAHGARLLGQVFFQ